MFSFQDLKQEYSELWTSMVISTSQKCADSIARAISTITNGDNQARYKQVTDRTGVPWIVVGIIHSMECNCNMQRHLHNGDPLTARTVHVPSGRPPNGDPPFNWIESAVDAVTFDGLAAVKDWPVERVAYEFERFNGFGYREAPGRGNSAYLWSCTNHYTKGKFGDDGHFNPELVSDQPGAMALFSQLTGPNFKIEAPQPNVTAEVVPLMSDLFFAIGPFELLPTATSKPGDAASPEVVEEDEPCRKIGEVGPIWEIELPDRTTGQKHGFARGGIFKRQAFDPDVNIEQFAQLCLDAAREYKTSAYHLIALSDLDTGIHNVAAKIGDGAGPFLITSVDWANTIAPGGTGLVPRQRFDPYRQPFVAAQMAAHAAEVLQANLPNNRLPTSAELYLANLVGASHAINILGSPDGDLFTAIVKEIGAKADELRQVWPWVFQDQTDVKGALVKIARRMDFGYARADTLFKRVEPDLEIATAATTGFASRLEKQAATEWEFFGEQARNLAGAETKAGHKENEARVPPGSGEDYFARVGTYWRDVTGQLIDGRDRDKPWSAVFISYVVKSANPAGRFRGSARHSEYISRAINDTDKNDEAGYWCKRLNEHQPAVGDIICWAREPGVDYDHQKGGDYDGHCDIVVEVRANEIDVIGGNVGDSVTRRTFARDANGFVRGGHIQGEDMFAIMVNRIP